MNSARLILYFLTGIFVGQIFYYYPNLPARMATHFDGAGRADGWMTKEAYLIFDFILLFVVLAEFALVPRLIERMPDSMINLPNKDFWLAKERRGATFQIVRNYFAWFSIALLSLFLVINQAVIRANLEGQDLSAATMWLVIGVFLAFVGVWLVKFIRQFKAV